MSLKVSLSRSGGVAGISPPAIVVDSEDLPADEGQALQQLVDAAGYFDLPAELGPAGDRPDSFGYTLSVSDERGRTHAVSFDHGAAPQALKDLVAAIRKANRAAR